MLRALIVDDDRQFIDVFIKEFTDIRTKLQFDIEIAAIDKVVFTGEEEYDYDIFFIDVELEDASGIEIVQSLKRIQPDKEYVFVSAYDKYMKPAFFVKPRSYISKMNLHEELKQTMIFMKELFGKKMHSKQIYDNHKLIEVYPHRVCYCMSEGHYVDLVDECNKKRLVRTSLNAIEEAFCEYHFIRIHNRYLVNLEYIESFGEDKILLKNKEVLKISRSYRKQVEEGIMKWFDYMQSI